MQLSQTYSFFKYPVSAIYISMSRDQSSKKIRNDCLKLHDELFVNPSHDIICDNQTPRMVNVK